MLISIVQQSDSKWFLCLIFKGECLCANGYTAAWVLVYKCYGTTEHELTSNDVGTKRIWRFHWKHSSTQINVITEPAFLHSSLPTWVAGKVHICFSFLTCVVTSGLYLKTHVEIIRRCQQVVRDGLTLAAITRGQWSMGVFVSIAGSPSTQEVSVLAV